RPGTRSPATCWRTATTSAPSRSCWATGTSTPDDLHPRPQPGPGGGAEPGRPNVHVMNLDRPDYHAAGTDQISREVALYIIALGPGVFSKAAERWASLG